MLVIIAGVAVKETPLLFLQLHLTGQLSEVKGYLSPMTFNTCFFPPREVSAYFKSPY